MTYNESLNAYQLVYKPDWILLVYSIISMKFFLFCTYCMFNFESSLQSVLCSVVCRNKKAVYMKPLWCWMRLRCLTHKKRPPLFIYLYILLTNPQKYYRHSIEQCSLLVLTYARFPSRLINRNFTFVLLLINEPSETHKQI